MRITKKVVIDLLTDQVIERDSFEYNGPLAKAVAGTAISMLAEWPVRGGQVQWWTATIDPGSIAAAAQELETFAIPGARAGDPVFASMEAPNAAIIVGGAKITANDVVTVYLSNNITVTTATDAAAAVVHIQVLKRSTAVNA